MKRIMIFSFLFLLLFASCGKRAIPVFADTRSLASAVWEEANLDITSVCTETLDSTSALLIGIERAEFDARVKNGVILRPAIDDVGRVMYVLEMKSAADARRFAEKISRSYEWAPCDNAKKLTVVCAEEYLMVFKSTGEEVESAVSGFRRLSGGKLAYRKDLINIG